MSGALRRPGPPAGATAGVRAEATAGATARSPSRDLARVARGDDGSAIVEFVFLGVLMLLPIVYLVMALGRIQAGALAVEQGAREAGRAYVTSPDQPSAGSRAMAAATLAYGDEGFAPPSPSQLSVACPAPACLAPGGHVSVVTRLTVTLPGVPAFFSRIIPVAVTLSATHVSSVDEFGAR